MDSYIYLCRDACCPVACMVVLCKNTCNAVLECSVETVERNTAHLENYRDDSARRLREREHASKKTGADSVRCKVQSHAEDVRPIRVQYK